MVRLILLFAFFAAFNSQAAFFRLKDQPKDTLAHEIKTGHQFELGVVQNFYYDPGKACGAWTYTSLEKYDLSIIESTKTVAELEAAGTKVYVLSPDPLVKGEDFLLGDMPNAQTCHVDTRVFRLRESVWEENGHQNEWIEPYKYNVGCHRYHGLSGAPLINRSGEIAGIHNTGNDGPDARKLPPCSNSRPCEVSERGDITEFKDAGYAQPVDQLYGCFRTDFKFDLYLPTCPLAKGSRPKAPVCFRKGP